MGQSKQREVKGLISIKTHALFSLFSVLQISSYRSERVSLILRVRKVDMKEHGGEQATGGERLEL